MKQAITRFVLWLNGIGAPQIGVIFALFALSIYGCMAYGQTREDDLRKKIEAVQLLSTNNNAELVEMLREINGNINGLSLKISTIGGEVGVIKAIVLRK